MHANLANKTLSGGTVTVFAQFLKFILQLISNIVLARLLSPEDFGVLAMVSVVTSFIFLFKDLGLSAATVQRAKINHAQVSTLFWINVLFGFVVFVIAILVSPLIATFYDDERITLVTMSLSLGLFISGVGVQHQALLRRQMQFFHLANIEILSIACGIAVGILAALYGLEYWALVLMQVSTPLFATIGFWLCCKWRPGPMRRNSGAKELIRFGGYLTGFGLVNYFSRNMDTLLLGWKWGAAPTGHYSRAYSLLLLPLGQLVAPLSAIAIPALSRTQTEPDRYQKYYYSIVKLLAYVTMPLIIYIAVNANEIVEIILGSQWTQAGELFQLLAFAAIWQPVGSTVGWVYTSLGRTDRMFYWGLVSTPIVVGAFLIGLNWGAYGVALSYSIVINLLIVPIFAFAFKGTCLSVAVLFKNIKYPIILSLLILVTTLFAKLQIQLSNSYSVVFVTFVASILSLLFAWFVFSGLREDLNNLIASVRKIRSKK